MPSTKAQSTLGHEVQTAERKTHSADSWEPPKAVPRESPEAKIAEYIAKTVAAAPPLNDEQRSRLAALIGPGRLS